MVRSKNKGPFTEIEMRNLGALMGPLNIALEFHRRLAAASNALDHVKEGVFLIDDTGKIRHANAAGERMLAEKTPVSADGNRLVIGQARVSRYRISGGLGFGGATEAVFVEAAPKMLTAPASFGWTPSESRVALLIGEGLTIRDIADRSRLTEHTVRNQLKHAMHKAGARRQAELVAFIWRSRDLAI